ncbi:MAG: metallophosphoesterase [Betaproteobacteria bacterium]|nr:metallophosphoesterase [Betaproteobacteria bacterium]
MPIFFLILGIYFLANFWLIARLFFALQGAGIFRILSCLFVSFASCAYLLARMLEGNAWPERLIALIGSLWISLALYSIILLFAVDVFRLLNRSFHWLPQLNSGMPAVRYAVCAAIAAGALTISVIGWINTATPVVREVELSLSTPPGSALEGRTLKIAALSDIHLGRMVSAGYFSGLIDLIEPQHPDLLLFLGDVLDDHHGLDEKAMRAGLQRMNPPLGIWGILGNHEYISGEAEKSIGILERSGIRILRDQWAAPGGELLLVGRDDRSKERFTGRTRAALPEILATVPEGTRRLPMILLDHQPLHLEEAEAAGAALQLSGHTHGGQLFPINFIVSAIYENAHGHSQRGMTHYWVTSGAGTWGPRVRTAGRPEILLIKIKFDALPQ